MTKFNVGTGGVVVDLAEARQTLRHMDPAEAMSDDSLRSIVQHLRDDPEVSWGAVETYYGLLAETESSRWATLADLAARRDATVSTVCEWIAELEYSGVAMQGFDEQGSAAVRRATTEEMRQFRIKV